MLFIGRKLFNNLRMKNLFYIYALFSGLAFAAQIDLRTTAEKSRWENTGRAEEAQKLCQDFQKRFPSRVQCKSYGSTPEKRNLPYLIVGNLKDPVVWVQAGIHAGEIDGKDAVFWLMRNVLEGGLKPDPFKGICMVFIPIVNVDGHERFGHWNRPNQVGPYEMGWRTTAQNLNLNRDFLKADAMEMRHLLKLWHQVDPVLSLDLHVTDGAQFVPEVGFIIHPHTSFGATPLHQMGQVFETALLEKMKARGHVALPFYPSFEDEENPESGFSRYVSTPRFAHGYWYNNNRLGMLVETHSWKDYATRVKTHYNTVLGSLELAQKHGQEWKKAEKALDAENLAGKSVELEYKHTEKFSILEFPGYKYAKVKSVISGGNVIKYDPSTPVTWKVPYYEEIKATFTTTAPEKGYYVVPADSEWLLPKLAVHGIKYVVADPNDLVNLHSFKATKTTFSPNSFEGRQTLIVEGDWKPDTVELPDNTIFIPINQPSGRLVLQMFEPKGKDSFLSWGFFNKAFEQKEYMENYVAEEVGEYFLTHPEVKAEFEKKLKDDLEFAKSPEKRFDFFYRKHPSWDERFNRYPVFRK